MGHGGARQGAGRKKGERARAIERMNEAMSLMVEASLCDIVAPQIEKAKNGDTQAFIALTNRGIGLPRQNIGLSGEEEGDPIKTVQKINYVFPKNGDHTSPAK